ncbi:MAG TPA: hypothetical protein VES36_01840 [Candidatus Limnocylindrales bacterium]|nr:hypothetical protein [Candidatus Limnocylindrales bacterium]
MKQSQIYEVAGTRRARFHDEAARPAGFSDQPRLAAQGGGGRMSVYVSWLIALAVLLGAIFFLAGGLPGCTDSQFSQSQQQVEAARDGLNSAQAQLHELTSHKAALDQIMADLEANPPTTADPEARAEWDARLADIREQLAKITPRIEQLSRAVDDYVQKLNALADQIANSQTGEEAMGETISTGGGMIGTMTGQPLISLVSGLVGGVLTWFGSRKRLKAAGAASVAVGIEAARDDSLEKKNPGFIVFEKESAEIAHKASGVSDAIEKSTTIETPAPPSPASPPSHPASRTRRKRRHR